MSSALGGLHIMQDLTQGSITRHLLSMAAFIGAGLVFQTLYFLVDLYFVSRLGENAIAGVSAAGTTFFLILAASQLVSVGAMALIAQAIGRKDEADANLMFNQAMSMALFGTIVTLVLGYCFVDVVVGAVSADAATAREGKAYLIAFLPNLALMFPAAALVSALRGAGVVGPPMVVQTLSLVLNAVLAPVLIAGWGTGVPLGVAGAGLASTIAAIVGCVALLAIFPRVQKYLRAAPRAWTPDFAAWRRIIGVGLPTACEFTLMFIIFSVTYWLIRPFGAHAQAGFGIGVRIMQSIFLPAMAIAFAAAPIAGQNFGARRPERVREVFRQAALIGSALMLTLSVLCVWRPDLLMHVFTNEQDVADVGVTYLRTLAWIFMFNGLAFTCSSVFQGLGNTLPSLMASGSRLFTFVAPALWLSQQPGTRLEDFWHLSVASVLLQALIAFVLLRVELRKKLSPMEEAGA
jgi:putative MATE family efflux protein